MKRHYWIWIRLLEKLAAAQPEMALNYHTATRPQSVMAAVLDYCKSKNVNSPHYVMT